MKICKEIMVSIDINRKLVVKCKWSNNLVIMKKVKTFSQESLTIRLISLQILISNEISQIQ